MPKVGYTFSPKITGYLPINTGLWLCGYNVYGELGNSTFTNSSSLIQTYYGTSGYAQISAGSINSYAIRGDGTLWACGYNNGGQLGDGTTTNRSSPVQTMAGGTNWRYVATPNGSGVARPKVPVFAIKIDGTLWAWGGNANGVLGDSTTSNRSSPIQIGTEKTWAAISCSLVHTLGIKTDGTLWGWGINNYGQLGDSTTTSRYSPTQIGSATTWKQVATACNNSNSYAIKTDNTLWACGYNGSGAIGDNTTTHRSTFVQVLNYQRTGYMNATQVSAGSGFAAALVTDGALCLWGFNINQLLGTGDPSSFILASEQESTLSTNWTQVACGYQHILAVKSDSTIWGWGYNTSGELLGASSIVSIPTQFAGAKKSLVSNISGGYQQTLMAIGTTLIPLTDQTAAVDIGDMLVPRSVFTEGSLWTVGRDNVGQLGDSSTATKYSWVQTIGGGLNWKQVASSNQGVCAGIKTDGSLWLWGYNNFGQLGDSTRTNRSSPVQHITPVKTWYQVSCGYYHHAAIRVDGTLWTCGGNTFGQLGDSSYPGASPGVSGRSSPVQTIAGGNNWKYVVCGAYHNLALKADGSLWAWGWCGSGILGDGSSAPTVTSRSSPVQIGTELTWKQVSANYTHSAGVKTDGTLWCWGANVEGELGDSTIAPRSSPVQTISGGTTWKQVACGYRFTAAIKTDGTYWCWGYNSSGQLGDSTTTYRSSPVQVIGNATNWKTAFAGHFTAVGLKTDGTLWVWGYNQYGVLGDSSTTNRSSPIQLGTLTNWKYAAVNSSGYYIRDDIS